MRSIPWLLTVLSVGAAHAFPWYASGDNIRGAELMKQDERKTYVVKLQGMKTVDECQAYMQAHNLELDRRAKEQNVRLPPMQGDPCVVMKSMGRIR